LFAPPLSPFPRFQAFEASKADAVAITRAKEIAEETARVKRKALKDKAKGISGSAYHAAWEDADYDENDISVAQ